MYSLFHQRGSANDSNSTLFVKLKDAADTWTLYVFKSQFLVVYSELKIKYQLWQFPTLSPKTAGWLFWSNNQFIFTAGRKEEGSLPEAWILL